MNYYVKFVNNTKEVRTMGVYQTLPNSPGLESVSWKQTSAAQGGKTTVNWSINYGVSLSDYKQSRGGFMMPINTYRQNLAIHGK